MPIDDGGPAFPQQVIRDGEGLLQIVTAYGFESGMSARQVYAAVALNSLLGGVYTTEQRTRIANEAVRMADALIAALKT